MNARVLRLAEGTEQSAARVTVVALTGFHSVNCAGARVVKRKAILVVDDDPGILRAVERLLRTLGFEPDTYESVDDFRARADLSNAICLLLDIHLNHVSGIELARELKASGSLLPIIFITADDSAPTRKMARDVGCIAYLAKPFTAKSLTRAIDKVLIQPSPPDGRGHFI